MLEIALTSFTTFFATVGPVEAAVLFATLTPKMEQSARAAIAIRATAIAGSLLLIFTLFGQPLLAGPGAMSAGILLAANADGNALSLATTVGALAAVMAVTLALLLLSHQLNQMIGITAQRVLMRVFGILLAAIAVQAMFNGLASIGVIHLPN